MELMNLRRGLMMQMSNAQNKKFELIRVVTLDQDSQYVVLDSDNSGDPFIVNGFLLCILSVGASDATAEAYLKVALNSNNHGANRIIDHITAIRKAGSYTSLAVYGAYIDGVGHFVIDTKQDAVRIVNGDGTILNSIYGAVTSNFVNVGFSNQKDISSIYVGTDNASQKLGAGSIIALYGRRK